MADALSRIVPAVDELHINETSSDVATVHSTDTDDSEYIACTELPVNFFHNQIILRIGEENSKTYEEVFPRVYRRTITKLIFGVPAILKIFKECIDT